jgi:hypothetical protein
VPSLCSEQKYLNLPAVLNVRLASQWIVLGMWVSGSPPMQLVFDPKQTLWRPSLLCHFTVCPGLMNTVPGRNMSVGVDVAVTVGSAAIAVAPGQARRAIARASVFAARRIPRYIRVSDEKVRC